MKKQFKRLSKAEQEKIEKKYHQMNPADFDDMMSEAATAATASIRLPGKIVEALRIVGAEISDNGKKVDYRASAARGTDGIAIVGNAAQRGCSSFGRATCFFLIQAVFRQQNLGSFPKDCLAVIL